MDITLWQVVNNFFIGITLWQIVLYVVHHKNFHDCRFLIDRGADLSLVNNDGDLAIDIADSDEMESLLQREIELRGT